MERYRKTYAALAPRYTQLHLIDTTKLSERAMVETVASQTLDILEQKAKSHA